MRVFHKQRNWKHCPTINTDKLWTLVSEKTKADAKNMKDKAPVIDVTNSVSSASEVYSPLISMILTILILNIKI